MSWQHRLLEIEGRPAQVLIDDRFASVAPLASLVNLAWFGIFCRDDPGNAFWAIGETEQLDAIEDDLIRLCDKFGDGWAAYLRRVDTSGIREYYIYWGETANMAKVLSAIKSLYPSYRIEYDNTSDPGWRHYQSWVNEMKAQQ
jgi:hypothetical protein